MQPLYRAVWVLLLTAFVAPVRADVDCGQLLTEADTAYQNGKFEDALVALDTCLDSGPSPSARVPVLALKAKVQLVMDQRPAATDTISRLLKVDSGFTGDPLRDPPLFLSMVEELRQVDTTVKISSVSKTPESLREAPATVVVVTAEQIRRRGYMDLEAVLHDLPGFDISRTNGLTYSNVYQRGFNSDLTNRTPVLIDGVEENDLFINAVFLSRQFPLINVERIEVIYGPASTMYGANAFAGVINVVTREPEDLVSAERRFAFDVDATAGSFGTRTVDALLSGQSKDATFKWTLTGRVYRSDEPDLSRYDEWAFDPAFYDSFDYSQVAALNFEGTAAQVAAAGESDYFDVDGSKISINDAGQRRAAELDRSLFTTEVRGHPATFLDPTDDVLLHGKVKLPNLVVGFQTWRREEGWTPWRTDQVIFGDNVYIQKQQWLYARYAKKVGRKLQFEYFARYKDQEVDGASRDSAIRNYARGRLKFEQFLDGEPPSLQDTYFYTINSQLINELKVVYTPSDRLTLVSGVELKNSSVNGSYVLSGEPDPSETGSPASDFGGDNQFKIQDLGLYSQASYRVNDRFKAVFGVRADDNEIRETGGYGMVFNPRLALIYSWRDLVFKAIYAEAFQDASNFQKFNQSSNGNFLANPNIDPEKVKNAELTADWEISEDFSVDAAFYESRYSDVIGFETITDCTIAGRLVDNDDEPGNDCKPGISQWSNGIGELEVRGVQANAYLKAGRRFDAGRRFQLFGNYTYTDPLNVEKGKRIGDVASHQVNLGVDVRLSETFRFNLRTNFVGTKKTGLEETDVDNGIPGGEIDSYFVVHGALTYAFRKQLELQLIAHNLFDTEYFHPGIRVSENFVRPYQFPQPERSAYLRVSYSF